VARTLIARLKAVEVVLGELQRGGDPVECAILVAPPYSSRPGSCSRSAPPHGPTPRTTTARRAQPFSASDLRRSSSTFRPIAACVIACRPPARSTPAIGPSAWCKDPGATSIVPSLAPPIAPSEHHSESVRLEGAIPALSGWPWPHGDTWSDLPRG
jgi:hypothetical protein